MAFIRINFKIVKSNSRTNLHFYSTFFQVITFRKFVTMIFYKEISF
jgi:hypothetical protein